MKDKLKGLWWIIKNPLTALSLYYQCLGENAHEAWRPNVFCVCQKHRKHLGKHECIHGVTWS